MVFREFQLVIWEVWKLDDGEGSDRGVMLSYIRSLTQFFEQVELYRILIHLKPNANKMENLCVGLIQGEVVLKSDGFQLFLPPAWIIETLLVLSSKSWNS